MTLGDHLRRHRLDLELLQRTVAERLGVREETITVWETGRARPLPKHYGRIVRFLGYDPEPAGVDLPDRLRAVRRRLGLTQVELAARLGQDEHQICRWERGRRTPHPAIVGRIELALRELAGRPAGEGSEPARYFDLTRWRRKPAVGVSALPATFGERLRARRLELGLSETYVVRQARTSRGTLYRIERGRQKAAVSLERRLRKLFRPR